MTDTPMTPDRERMIRIWHEELFRLRDVTAVARREALGDLLAEVDRLRAELEARPTHTEVLNEAADHFDATLEGRFVTRHFGHQVAAELRVLAISSQGAAKPEVERLRARVAELEAQRSAVLALHRKHDDSEHCFADDEAWPCNTRTTLTTGRDADATTAEHHVVDGALHLCHTDDHYCPQDAAETEVTQ